MEPRHSVPTAEVAGRRSGLTTMVVWALWAVSVLLIAISVAAEWSRGTDFLLVVISNVVALSFATVGAILVSRLPGNVIGWLLASGGFCFAVGNGATSLADAGLNADPGSVPGAIWFAWLGNWIWAPAIGAIVGLTLVYPSGRLLSRRWRPVALAATAVITLLTIGTATGPWPDGQFPVENPLLITGGFETLFSALGVVVGPLAILVAILAVASLVLRYRRSTGAERQQLKWFAFVTAVSVPSFLVASALYGATGVAGVVGNLAGFVAYMGFALLPVAIGVAVLRYRLYEIDRLISRSISWTAITGVLVAVFVAVILLIQAALAQVTTSNTVAVATSTVVVFALFQPLRRRIQTRVDGRFNRARYDAERTLAAFAGRLRDEVDLQELEAEITVTVTRTVQPAAISLWIRG